MLFRSELVQDGPFLEFDVVVPVPHKGRNLALLFVGGMQSVQQSHDRDELVGFLQALTNIMVVAIENRKLARRELEQEALRKELEAALDGAVLPRDEIEMAAATYLVYYGNHIAKEDEDILGRAGSALQPADWEAVRNAVPLVPDPVFGQHSGSEYRELRRQIAREA